MSVGRGKLPPLFTVIYTGIVGLVLLLPTIILEKTSVLRMDLEIVQGKIGKLELTINETEMSFIYLSRNRLFPWAVFSRSMSSPRSVSSRKSTPLP